MGADRLTLFARRFQDIGCATAPRSASNRGLETRAQIEIIIEQATVRVVVHAGIGLPSHAAAAMELGADAVLVNTAIASDPAAATHAGRLARELGLGSSASNRAVATSPLTAFLG